MKLYTVYATEHVVPTFGMYTLRTSVPAQNHYLEHIIQDEVITKYSLTISTLLNLTSVTYASSTLSLSSVPIPSI